MCNENVIAGKNAVLEYLLSDKQADTLYILKSRPGLSRHIALAKQKNIVVKDTDAAKMDRLAGGAKHGGAVLTVPEAGYASLDDLLEVSKRNGRQPFIIIADEITDPHNLGALIRTAEAAGADGIVIPRRRSAGLNQTVYATSAGAAGHLPVCREANLHGVIERLKSAGIWVYGADADGEPFREEDFTGGIALVIGSEGSGLRRLVRESCDKIIAVDMYGKINSLNASVCGGVLMYEVVRQRNT